MTRIRHAKLFAFLRHHRHELFDESFQQELANLYQPSKRGHLPIAPAQLALAVILQAYMGASDDEVVEATLMDRCWQLVLGCLDADQPSFSKGTFVAFRKRLIDAQMDRRLIERTIDLGSATQAFGPRALHAALDSSPLWGAGRIEDTYNLIGHGLKKTLRLIARNRGETVTSVGNEAGAQMICGSSLKAVLDRDWDQVGQREEALELVLPSYSAPLWVTRVDVPPLVTTDDLGRGTIQGVSRGIGSQRQILQPSQTHSSHNTSVASSSSFGISDGPLNNEEVFVSPIHPLEWRRRSQQARILMQHFRVPLPEQRQGFPMKRVLELTLDPHGEWLRQCASCAPTTEVIGVTSQEMYARQATFFAAVQDYYHV